MISVTGILKEKEINGGFQRHTDPSYLSNNDVVIAEDVFAIQYRKDRLLLFMHSTFLSSCHKKPSSDWKLYTFCLSNQCTEIIHQTTKNDI